MDVGGVSVVKPIYEAAKATYVTLVDPHNALSDSFGFKVVPNGYLIDEAGVLQWKQEGGFEVKSPRTIQAVDEFLARPKAAVHDSSDRADPIASAREALRLDPDDPAAKLALGKLLLTIKASEEVLSLLKQASDAMPGSAIAQFTYGSALLSNDEKRLAVEYFRRALRLDPKNFVIRKQIWYVEHPERFWPEIDWIWQREQLAKELEDERKGGGGR